jgi:hypothetical protein
MLGQMLVLMQMTFLNNARKVGRLVLSRTSCYHLCLLLHVMVVTCTHTYADINCYQFTVFQFSAMLQ